MERPSNTFVWNDSLQQYKPNPSLKKEKEAMKTSPIAFTEIDSAEPAATETKPKRTRAPEDPAIKAIRDNAAKEARAMKEIIKAVDRIVEVVTTDSLKQFTIARLAEKGIAKQE